jgi:excisionase family DNA binding protein
MDTSKEELKEIIKQAIQEAYLKEPKLTLTIKDAAELSGIGREKITELTFSNDFPAFKVGNKTLINRDMFIVWLDKITVEKKQL